jgi:DNA-binding CsgD family transcriptional regulator
MVYCPRHICPSILSKKILVHFLIDFKLAVMRFKEEELVEREIEIASYLLQNLSLNLIRERTALSKKHIVAHIRNMMEKLRVKDIAALLKALKAIK